MPRGYKSGQTANHPVYTASGFANAGADKFAPMVVACRLTNDFGYFDVRTFYVMLPLLLCESER